MKLRKGMRLRIKKSLSFDSGFYDGRIAILDRVVESSFGSYYLILIPDRSGTLNGTIWPDDCVFLISSLERAVYGIGDDDAA